MTNSNYHIPVLLNDVIEGLAIQPNGTYVDVTFGGGGHSRAILEQLEEGRLIGFDQDEDARQNLIDDARFTFVKQNFSFLKNFLKFHKALPADGILADLGVSSHQFNAGERGFSLRFDAKLDMRMDQSQTSTAADVVNTYDEADLRNLFYKYGELKNSSKIARTIVQARTEKKITHTLQLNALLEPFAPRKKENQFFARIYQALRIEVNAEMAVLESFLEQTAEALKPGGRLVVISYHSLEDRLVKNFMRTGKFRGEVEKDFYGNPLKPFQTITTKPIVPTDKEIELNNRARSAKLRIARKL